MIVVLVVCTDRLKEVIKSERLPFKVYPVVNNGKPLDDEHYGNAGTEAGPL